jgi:chromosome segregation ATPase
MERISKFYTYIKKSIRGPFYPKELAQIPGFNKNSLVCPESALGQWREAYLEPAFHLFLANHSPRKPAMPISDEAKALRPVLEKTLRKNHHFETEVKMLKQEYSNEKRHFEDDLRKKDDEIKTLMEKLKRASSNARANAEHPSWETLYKTYKKRAEDKNSSVIQDLSEQTEEVLKLKTQVRDLSDEYADYKRDSKEDQKQKIKAFESEMEDRDASLKNHDSSMESMINKNEEFQTIMMDERRDYEIRSKEFCEEIGKLKSEIKWCNKENNQLKNDLFEAFNKLKEFESVGNIKAAQQKEIYNAIRSKISLLSGYFENLESKVRYTFGKEGTS